MAVAPLLSKEPAQPPAEHDWAVPHMAEVGRHSHPAHQFWQVDVAPLLLKAPAQLLKLQLCGVPQVLTVGVHPQPAPQERHWATPVGVLKVPAQPRGSSHESWAWAGHVKPGVLADGMQVQPDWSLDVQVLMPFSVVPLQLATEHAGGDELQDGAAAAVDVLDIEVEDDVLALDVVIVVILDVVVGCTVEATDEEDAVVAFFVMRKLSHGPLVPWGQQTALLVRYCDANAPWQFDEA